MDLKKLGTIIRNKREEIGIPPSVLADRAGIQRHTLWIYERGENPKTGKPSRPSKDKLERLAEVLRMSQAETEELLSLADYKVTNQPQAVSDHILPIEQSGSFEQPSSSTSVSLAVANGTVFVANNGCLKAFSAETGEPLWSTPTSIQRAAPDRALVDNPGTAENNTSASPLDLLEQAIDAIEDYPLRSEDKPFLVELMLSRIRMQLTTQQLELVVFPSTKNFLTEKGFDERHGALPLRRVIHRVIEEPIAEALAEGKFHPGDVIEAAIVDDEEPILQVRDRTGQLSPSAPREAVLV